MPQISISHELKKLLPSLRLGWLECAVQVTPGDEKLELISEKIIGKLRSELTIEEVSRKPAIKETKEAYRILGKDPSRYRPSAEALTRRIVNGKELYRINNIVDLLNLISLESGFSIGGYDMDKIVGDIEFGIGRMHEPYQAIGRGDLNIENLPLFRDDLGAFGSPTSDSLRTMVTDETKNFLMVIIDFSGNKNLENTLHKSETLYREIANASDIRTQMIFS